MGESYPILTCVDSRRVFDQLPVFSSESPVLPKEATELKIQVDSDFPGREISLQNANSDDVLLRAMDFDSDGNIDAVSFYANPFPDTKWQWLILNPDSLDQGFMTHLVTRGETVFRLPAQKPELSLHAEDRLTLSLLEEAVSVYLNASRDGLVQALNPQEKSVIRNEAQTSVDYYCEIVGGPHSASYHFRAEAQCDPWQMVTEAGSVEADFPMSVTTQFYRQSLTRILDGSALPRSLAFTTIEVNWFDLNEGSPDKEAWVFVESAHLSCLLQGIVVPLVEESPAYVAIED